MCDIDEVDTPGKEETSDTSEAGEEEEDGPPLPPRTPAPLVIIMIMMMITMIIITVILNSSPGNYGKPNPHLSEPRGEESHGNTPFQRRTHGGSQ